MFENQKPAIAASILASMNTKEKMIADEVRGGKHEVNSCGSPMGCAATP